MKKIILTMLFFTFISSLFFNSPIVLAEDCGVPYFYRESGSGLSPIPAPLGSKLITLNASEYPPGSGWVKYNLQVRNANNQGVLVNIHPLYSFQKYVHGNSLYVPGNQPDTRLNLTIEVWLRAERGGALKITGVCDDGQQIDKFIRLSLLLGVYSNENIEPDGGCFPPPPGCSDGLFVTYSCIGNSYSPVSVCTNSCCQSFGGQDAFCSENKKMCVSPYTIPPATEGNIAFICHKNDCREEKDIILQLKLLGWNVTGKSASNWYESEFNNYDIIACYFSGGCRIKLNSMIYNQHVDKDKPFLEISNAKSINAGNLFGYSLRKTGSNGKQPVFVTSSNPIVGEFFGSFVNVINSLRPKFASVRDSSLSNEVTDLADSGNNTIPYRKSSAFFIVDDAPSHGRYAFIGWLSYFKIGQLNDDGELLLNRTLHWLKDGNDNRNKIGRVALLCSRDDCKYSREMDLMKWLRSIGYSVEGKSLKSWTENELKNFDVIVCSDSRTCSFKQFSAPYNATVEHDVGFLEAPSTRRARAAELFGITDSDDVRAQTTTFISSFVSDFLNAGFSDIILYDKRTSLYGVDAASLVNAIDLFHLFGDYSTMFRSESGISYVFVGWLGRNSVFSVSDEGRELLERAVNWLNCGKISCP